jgi:hypothetical protein
VYLNSCQKDPVSVEHEQSTEEWDAVRSKIRHAEESGG